jgi:Tfp pilus assembly protein PilF
VKFQDPLTLREHLQLAALYEAQGKTDAAVKEYKEVLNDDASNVDALLGLGDVAFRAEKMREARRHYAAALKHNPRNPRALNNIAMVEWKLNRFGSAEKFASAAAAEPGPFQPYALDTLANVLISQGQWARAQAAIDAARRTALGKDIAFAEGLAETQGRLTAARRQEP